MKLIPLVSVGVQRQVNGKNMSVHTEIGKPFDFTDDEKADLDALTAKTNEDYYRLPVNEAPDDLAPADKVKAPKAPKAKAADPAATDSL